MKVGFLTAPFAGESLESVVKFASEAGFDALEVIANPGSKHIDPTALKDSDVSRIQELFQKHNLEISSLVWYGDIMNPDSREANSESFRKLIDAADKLDVDVVCTLAGFAYNGKSKFQTIDEDAKVFFPPLLDYAGEKGIKIALENWFATLLQGLAHFEHMFQAIPHENFGLNFDPSHLVHQEIDYLKAVDYFKDRIFHTHAKDTEIRYHKRSWVGTQGDGWWRYVIPGFGLVDWGPYFAQLRLAGFDGAVSIEHEDGTFSREEGMIKGLAFLRQFV